MSPAVPVRTPAVERVVGWPSFAVAVTHASFDPARRDHLRRMQSASGFALNSRAELPPWVTSVTVASDPMRRGVWYAARSALAAPTRGASHLLVLSDDMVPCMGGAAEFWPALRRAVAEVPDRPLSLMTMGQAPERAVERGERWVRGTDALWAGSLVWPVPMVEDLTRFLRGWVEPCVEGHPDEAKIHDDHRFAVYCRTLGVEAWTPAPLLLSHVAGLPSLLGHPEAIGGQPRSARALAGDGAMPRASDVGWGRGADGLGRPAEQTPGGPADRPRARHYAAYLGGPTRRLLERVDARLRDRPWTSRLPGFDEPRSRLAWPGGSSPAEPVSRSSASLLTQEEADQAAQDYEGDGEG